jgi:magnesium-transporting ATPase (P-type)
MWVRDEHTGDVTEYELLALNEFTGERKRMSVVVRLPNGMQIKERFIIFYYYFVKMVFV